MKERKGNKTLIEYIDDCNVACVLCDAEDRVVYINIKAEQLMKKKMEIPYDISLYEKSCGFFEKHETIMPEKIEDEFEDFLYRNKDKKEEKYNKYVYFLKHANNKKKYMCFYKRSDQNNIITLTPHIYMEDICKTQKLKRFHDTICSQVNTLVHDMRTAVTLTSLNLQLLSDLLDETKRADYENNEDKQPGFNKKIDEYINAALEGCFVQNEYTVALTQLIEKEQGNAFVYKMPFDMVETIRRTMNFFENYARRNGVTIRFEGDTKPCIVKSDKIKIREAFANILQNAIKYTSCKTEGEKTVTVCIKCSKKYIKIIVADTGVGIAEKDMDHIKEKYFRARMLGENITYGRGLGLFSAYNNIDLIDGKIKCISELGEGSKFIIKIPEEITSN